MPFSRFHRKLTTWLALWAMVLGALMPAVAQAAVAASDRSQWVEVCSASGMVWLKADPDNTTLDAASEPAKSMADMGNHCPWCGFHAPLIGLLPASVAVLPLMATAQAAPKPPEALFTGKLQHIAQARAPPLAS